MRDVKAERSGGTLVIDMSMVTEEMVKEAKKKRKESKNEEEENG